MLHKRRGRLFSGGPEKKARLPARHILFQRGAGDRDPHAGHLVQRVLRAAAGGQQLREGAVQFQAHLDGEGVLSDDERRGCGRGCDVLELAHVHVRVHVPMCLYVRRACRAVSHLSVHACVSVRMRCVVCVRACACGRSVSPCSHRPPSHARGGGAHQPWGRRSGQFRIIICRLLHNRWACSGALRGH